VMRLELGPADIAVLDARTEGWVAGLKLAALRLAEPGLGRQEATSFIQTLGTNHRFAAAFLVEEVVSRQPPAVQEFLLRSSILERMCAPLCDRLMQAVDGHGPNTPWPSEEVIEHLVRRNLFVAPLDEEGCWYRYHHIFRDLLRARLSKAGAGHALALHRAAAEWYEGQDLLKEAVKHALLTKDWDYAADMVEHYGVATVAHSELATVRDWCMSFPAEVMQRRPALCIVHAWSLSLAYREEDGPALEARLAQAEQGLAHPGLPERALLAPRKPPLPLRPWVLGNVIQLRARVRWSAYPDVDLQELLQAARQSTALLAEAADGLTDSANALSIACAYMAMSDAEAAERALAGVRRWSIEGRNYLGALTAIYDEAHLAFCQGKLDRVETICAEGRKQLSALLRNLEHDLPAIRCLGLLQGCARLERGDLPGAEEALTQALDLHGWSPWMELSGHVALARLRAMRGDRQGVADALIPLQPLGPHMLLCARGIALLEQLLMQPADPGLLAAASRWVSLIRPNLSKSVPLGIGPAPSIIAYTIYLAWAHVMVMLGEARAALEFLEPAAALAQKQGLLTRLIQLSLVQALAHNVLGESRRSWDALDRALAAAETCGHLRTFDQGQQLRKLLAAAAARGFRRPQIRAILDVIGWPAGTVEVGERTRPLSVAAEAPSAEPKQGAAELVEPLSEREQEILELVGAGLSNAQIAARLFIGTGTVKTHVNHLFGKLDATSRTQLVAKARILKLLC
jgi:LuxR family transcriptional regulator, maltose regulon positive regulatory protein